MSKYAAYFAMEREVKQIGFNVDRSELVSQFTDGQKNGLTDLSDFQYQEFLRWLRPIIQEAKNDHQENWKNSPENRMRRKIIALFIHRMGYTYKELDEWCVKSGEFKKALNDHTYNELTKLVTQAEKVHASFIQQLNK